MAEETQETVDTEQVSDLLSKLAALRKKKAQLEEQLEEAKAFEQKEE